MNGGILRGLGMAALACVFAATAQAQGRGHAKGQKVSGGEVVEPGRKVPPGLAKKGGLPPGQAKKIYNVNDGVGVLRDVFINHGYTVSRVARYNDGQYVYYRGTDGRIHRAFVGPGTDQLHFSNVPSAILREVLARLY
jgi:hypothetical protein